jgi:hypothetical protein
LILTEMGAIAWPEQELQAYADPDGDAAADAPIPPTAIRP